MVALTHQQRRAYDFIAEANTHGTSPTYDELCEHLDIASKGSLHSLLRRMEERGAIRWMPGRARSLEVIDSLAGKSRAELLALRDRIDRALAGRSQ